VKTTGKTSKQFKTATETSHGFTKAGCDWQRVVNLPLWKIVFFSYITFTWEVKVTAIFYRRIKHGLFPSLCIGENYQTVLEYTATHKTLKACRGLKVISDPSTIE